MALSLDSRRQFSVGEVTNLAVIEAARMTEQVYVAHLLFSLPIQVGYIHCQLFRAKGRLLSSLVWDATCSIG